MKRLNEALVSAAEWGELENVKWLLAQGVPVNSPKESVRSALVEAADEGRDIGETKPEQTRPKYRRIVQLLLKHGASVNTQAAGMNVYGGGAGGRTALMQASAYGAEEIVKMLLRKKTKVNIKDENGTTALMLTARGQSISIVRLLLSHGAKVNDENKMGYTALMAASLRSYEIARLLLAKGARVNADRKWIPTALIVAVYGDRWEAIRHDTIQVLTPQYLDVDSEEKLNFLRLLLAKGAQVNSQTGTKTTALLRAVHLGAPQTVLLLLNRGANPQIQQSTYKTALELAVRIRKEWKEQYKQFKTQKVLSRVQAYDQIVVILQRYKSVNPTNKRIPKIPVSPPESEEK